MRSMVATAFVLLAAVALPVAVGWWNRRRAARVDGSFPCKVRALEVRADTPPMAKPRIATIAPTISAAVLLVGCSDANSPLGSGPCGCRQPDPSWS